LVGICKRVEDHFGLSEAERWGSHFASGSKKAHRQYVLDAKKSCRINDVGEEDDCVGKKGTKRKDLEDLKEGTGVTFPASYTKMMLGFLNLRSKGRGSIEAPTQNSRKVS